jgi:uncharacterized protein involved in response to NO
MTIWHAAIELFFLAAGIFAVVSIIQTVRGGQ